MAVLEYREGLYFSCQLWDVHVIFGTHPPPASKTEHLCEVGMGMAVPAIQDLRRGGGRDWPREVTPLGTV